MLLHSRGDEIPVVYGTATANVDKIVGKIYELYSDYVMKNPFYQLEMPVRCEGWERRLVGYLRVLNSR